MGKPGNKSFAKCSTLEYPGKRIDNLTMLKIIKHPRDSQSGQKYEVQVCSEPHNEVEENGIFPGWKSCLRFDSVEELNACIVTTQISQKLKIIEVKYMK